MPYESKNARRNMSRGESSVQVEETGNQQESSDGTQGLRASGFSQENKAESRTRSRTPLELIRLHLSDLEISRSRGESQQQNQVQPSSINVSQDRYFTRARPRRQRILPNGRGLLQTVIDRQSQRISAPPEEPCQTDGVSRKKPLQYIGSGSSQINSGIPNEPTKGSSNGSRMRGSDKQIEESRRGSRSIHNWSLSQRITLPTSRLHPSPIAMVQNPGSRNPTHQCNHSYKSMRSNNFARGMPNQIYEYSNPPLSSAATGNNSNNPDLQNPNHMSRFRYTPGVQTSDLTVYPSPRLFQHPPQVLRSQNQQNQIYQSNYNNTYPSHILDHFYHLPPQSGPGGQSSWRNNLPQQNRYSFTYPPTQVQGIQNESSYSSLALAPMSHYQYHLVPALSTLSDPSLPICEIMHYHYREIQGTVYYNPCIQPECLYLQTLQQTIEYKYNPASSGVFIQTIPTNQHAFRHPLAPRRPPAFRQPHAYRRLNLYSDSSEHVRPQGIRPIRPIYTSAPSYNLPSKQQREGDLSDGSSSLGVRSLLWSGESSSPSPGKDLVEYSEDSGDSEISGAVALLSGELGENKPHPSTEESKERKIWEEEVYNYINEDDYISNHMERERVNLPNLYEMRPQIVRTVEEMLEVKPWDIDAASFILHIYLKHYLRGGKDAFKKLVLILIWVKNGGSVFIAGKKVIEIVDPSIRHHFLDYITEFALRKSKLIEELGIYAGDIDCTISMANLLRSLNYKL